MKKIVIIGSSNTDLVIKTDRIPDVGETVIGGSFMMTAGGKGANQAVTVARLGGDATFIARVGTDMFGRQALNGYREEGLDVGFIVQDNETPSGVALISVDSRGENCIVVAPGANDNLSIADIETARNEIETAEYLLMQLEVPMDVVEYAAHIAYAAGVRVILNPAPASVLSRELLSRLDIITPNRSECALLTGVDVKNWESAEYAAGLLLDQGVQNVVVTLGTMGALVKNRHDQFRVPARKVTAVDTTAAGDVFNGALAVAMAEGKELISAVKFATLAASISVTRMGAQSSVPTREELDALLSEMPEYEI